MKPMVPGGDRCARGLSEGEQRLLLSVASGAWRRVFGWLSLGMALAFLAIGWWPFSPAPRNRIGWISPGPGLAFDSPGVGFTSRAVLGDGHELPEAFSLELVIAPRGGMRAATQYILSLHDGRLPSAFAICQWKAELLLRIPDAANVRGFREVAVGGLDGPARVYTIVCRRTGTEVFIDGQLSGRFPHFRVPAAALCGRLVLGDAAGGKQPWSGNVFGLALLDRELDLRHLRRRTEAWQSRQVEELLRDPGIVALFQLDDSAGRQARNAISPGSPLELPERYGVVQKQAFSFPVSRWEFWRTGRWDAVVNLLGFVPFGLLTFLWLDLLGVRKPWRSVLIATLVGFVWSAVIETGQIWLPTRVSSATDLILNTSGSLVGAWLAVWWRGTFRRAGCHCTGRES